MKCDCDCECKKESEYGEGQCNDCDDGIHWDLKHLRYVNYYEADG